VSCMMILPSEPLVDCRDALAAPDTHRHEGVLATHSLELVERFHGEDTARRADRMTQRDPAAVRIRSIGRQSEIACHRQGLGREGLV